MLHTTGRGVAACWSILCCILGLGLLDEALLVFVIPLGCSELGGRGEGGLVVETVEDAGAEGRVAEDLNMALAGCLRRIPAHLHIFTTDFS